MPLLARSCWKQRSAGFLKPLQAGCGWPEGVRGPVRGTETDGSHSAKSLSQQTAGNLGSEAQAARALCPCPPDSSLEAGILGTFKWPSLEAASLSLGEVFPLLLPWWTSPEICLGPISNKQRLVPGAWTRAGGINSEMSIVTKCRHFRSGEGGSQANSMLLQPYRKPAGPSCQPAAIYEP